MAKQKKGEGFHSSAGLIRYFDAEEKTSLRISPKAIAVATVLVAVTLIVITYALPL